MRWNAAEQMLTMPLRKGEFAGYVQRGAGRRSTGDVRGLKVPATNPTFALGSRGPHSGHVETVTLRRERGRVGGHVNHAADLQILYNDAHRQSSCARARTGLEGK